MARPNKNNAQYFSHDADMRNDIKVKALRRKFSHRGYAVWCFMLETLSGCDNFEINLTHEIDRELLAADFDVSTEELAEIIEYCIKINLLQRNEETKNIYSEAHKRRFKEMCELREKRREYQRNRSEINRINGLKGGNPNFKAGQPNPYYHREEDNRTDITDITENVEKITEDNPKVKESKGKENKPIKKTPKGDKRKFTPPTVDEVKAYAQSKGYSIDPERFCDYYISNGWKVGRNPMKDWQATVRQWAARDREQHPTSTPQAKGSLGVGEFRDPQGRRTYGTSGQIVPEDAAPRPSAGHWWSDASRQWEKMA